MMMCFLFSGCQRGKEPGQKKEINVQTEKIEQPMPLKAKPDFQSKQGEKQLIPPKVKELVEEKKKEKSVEIGKVGLTEKEQKEFSSWRDKWDGRTLTEENAHKYLSILVRGSNTVKWYSDRELWGTGIFEDDICKFVDLLASSKSKEGYKLVAKILENPDEWVSNLKCVLGSMKSFGMKESVPLLRKYLDYKLPRDNFPEHEKSTKDLEMSIKLEAAGSLLALGDADTALPVLDELAEKEGSVRALYYLFSGPGKIIDEKGYKVVEKALNNPKFEVKIIAAMLLLDAKKINKEKAEEIALEILQELKDKTLKDYGLTYDPKGVAKVILMPGVNIDLKKAHDQEKSDGRACEYTMSFLGSLKSKKALPILRHIEKNNTEWWYTCWNNHAKEALLAIEGGEK